MRKKILAGFPLLTAAMIFLGLWIANKITTPHWRLALNQYIAYKASPPNALITVQRIVQASQPWRFSADMSSATFGDCFYFNLSYCYPIDQPLPDPPLPFPPEDLWCALVQSPTGEKEPGWVVYIALHQDLYNAAWVVHESANSLSSPRLVDDLSKIGCSHLIEPDQ